MISNEQFIDALPQFETTIIDNLCTDKHHSLQILNSTIIPILDTMYLKLTLKLDANVLVLIVSYDKFYKVPILYFQVFDIGEFDELIQVMKTCLVKDIPLSIDNHPLVPGTYFLCHPCETNETIQEFMKTTIEESNEGSLDEKPPLTYLIIWNSIYGIGMFKSLYVKVILSK